MFTPGAVQPPKRGKVAPFVRSPESLSADHARIRLLIAQMRAAYELSDDAGTGGDTHLQHDMP